MISNRVKPQVIGTSTLISFSRFKNLKDIPARIDTGARTSSLWASDIKVVDNKVKFMMFGPESKYYTGKFVTMELAGERIVTNSTGHEQQRIVVFFPIKVQGKKLRAKFTLSDRSTQSYPVLIGRNTLRGNFLVDCADSGEMPIFKYVDEKSEYNEREAI